MNINVSARKGVYDAFDLSDGRVGRRSGSDPDVHDDAARSGAAAARRGAPIAAKGTVQYRRALPPSVFLGPWAYVDHLVLAPGSATAPQAHQEIGEFYYVMNGKGTVKVGAETATIRSGDAVPIQLNETKSFENTGAAPLELLVVGIVRDANRKFDVVHATGARRSRAIDGSHASCSRRGSRLAPAVCSAQALRLFFIDVEGGQATLVVTPSGQSLLVDTGWPTDSLRDAERIAAAREESRRRHGRLSRHHALPRRSRRRHGAAGVSREVPQRDHARADDRNRQGRRHHDGDVSRRRSRQAARKKSSSSRATRFR